MSRSYRAGFESIALAILIYLFPSISAEAKCKNPWDCNKRGLERIAKGVEKTWNQARRDFSNGLNGIDPRLTQIGRDFDRMRLEFQSSVFTGPALERWIIASRNSSYPTAAPIYPEMRAAMQGWYSDGLLNRVRFKVGDNGSLNLGNNTLAYNDTVHAVTLIDVIIFRGPEEAADPAIWAHEMKHVQQYAEWGVRKFAIRYMRSWNSVEKEAYEVEGRFAAYSKSAHPEESKPGASYSWKQVGTSDCPGTDYKCLPGLQPVSGECNAGTANRASVCWQRGRNPNFPPGAAGDGCRGASDWCTYKATPASICRRGGNPGLMWVCSQD